MADTNRYGDRYYPHPLGAMFNHQWGIMDANDGTMLHHWRKGQRGRLWHSTETDARQLADTMNHTVPTSLGNVSIVGTLDPPTKENATQWAIYQAKTRPRPASNRKPFRECPTCHRMTKDPCEHP